MLRCAITLFVSCIVICSCAVSKPIRTPDGAEGFMINCSGAALTWGECFEKAGQVCGEVGYEIIERSGDSGGSVISGNQFGLYGGRIVTRTMLIRCKNSERTEDLHGPISSNAQENKNNGDISEGDRISYQKHLAYLLNENDTGDPEIQRKIGTLNMMLGNHSESIKWFTMAANSENTTAQVLLAGMYSDGIGAQKDIQKAHYWYAKAAENGEPFAQFCLGINYLNGYGAPKDYVQAYKWFNLSAANSPSPQPKWGDPAGGRDAVAQLMTPAQIAEAQRLSREFNPQR